MNLTDSVAQVLTILGALHVPHHSKYLPMTMCSCLPRSCDVDIGRLGASGGVPAKVLLADHHAEHSLYGRHCFETHR